MVFGSDLAAGYNPQTYLADILGRIAEHPIQKIDSLLPWHWTQ